MLPKHIKKSAHDTRADKSVVACAVVVKVRQAESV